MMSISIYSILTINIAIHYTPPPYTPLASECADGKHPHADGPASALASCAERADERAARARDARLRDSD